MVRLLLDTHPLLWWTSEHPRLDPAVRRQIATAPAVMVSMASVWEIAIKVAFGKLRADVGEVVKEIDVNGFQLLPIEPRHCMVLGGLPLHYRDPFDRLLVAQALREGLTLVTRDKDMSAYDVPIIPC